MTDRKCESWTPVPSLRFPSPATTVYRGGVAYKDGVVYVMANGRVVRRHLATDRVWEDLDAFNGVIPTSRALVCIGDASWQLSPRLVLFGHDRPTVLSLDPSSVPSSRLIVNWDTSWAYCWVDYADMHRSFPIGVVATDSNDCYGLCNGALTRISFSDEVQPDGRVLYKCSFQPQQKLARLSNADTALLNRCIYVAGGAERLDMGRMHQYALATSTWKRCRDLPHERMNLFLVACWNKIWAIGGINAYKQKTQTVFSYDPATDQWTEHPKLKLPPDIAVAFAT
eukprot:TRINITY_DN3807_c0_g1_i4.p1 TRINITY_DN3807_c0_g1~~TRINITY_DN3807_c0_g1_i4.p1  ORF type:complete len:283 (+),score=16.91 TRINITY_DN3807_c0_g1_i4:300-1148(+)